MDKEQKKKYGSKLKKKYYEIKSKYKEKKKKGLIGKINDELKKILEVNIGKIFIIFLLLILVFIVVPMLVPLYSYIGEFLENIIISSLSMEGLSGVISYIGLILLGLTLTTVFAVVGASLILLIILIIIFYVIKRLGLKVVRSKIQTYSMYVMALIGGLIGIYIGYVFVFPLVQQGIFYIPIPDLTDIGQAMATIWTYGTYAISFYLVIWIALVLSFGYLFVLINDLAFYIYRKYKKIKLVGYKVKKKEMTIEQKKVFTALFIAISVIFASITVYTIGMKPTILRFTPYSYDTDIDIPKNTSLFINNFVICVHPSYTPNYTRNMYGEIYDYDDLYEIKLTIYSLPAHHNELDPETYYDTFIFNMSVHYVLQIPRGYSIIGFGISYELYNKTSHTTIKTGFYFRYLEETQPYKCGLFSKFIVINKYSYNTTTTQLEVEYDIYEQFLLQDLLYYP